MHTLMVPPEVSPNTPWKSYVCLEKTDDIDHEVFGNKCPFCEMNRYAYKKKEEMKQKKEEAEKNGEYDEASTYAAEEERWTDISVKNKASKVAIMRGIERGAEEDGPKFLKVNVRTDEKDLMHYITKLFKDRRQESIDEAKEENGGVLPEDFEPENILDTYEGKDLKITVSRVFTKDGKPTDKTTISVVDYGKKKPLSVNQEDIDKWIDDEKVWSDVFVVKPYDYLEIIQDGGIPFYDKENKKWVPKIKKKAEDEEAKEKRIETASRSADEAINRAKEKAVSVNEEPEEDNEEDTEDLPF